MEYKLSNINSNFESYQQLINLFHACKRTHFDTIILKITDWFAANMSSALGALLDSIQNNFNYIDIQFDDRVGNILRKNDFLSFYGYDKKNDSYHTTIQYKKIKKTDSRYFIEYIKNDLFSRSEMPKMSDLLKKKIIENIYEIFINAQIHSESDYIYTCGQFYPKKNIIEFTITDAGIGFKRSIYNKFERDISSVNAMKLALRGTITTKNGIPGGLGLKMLSEFIEINRGKFQIITYEGFYEKIAVNEMYNEFDGYFPGTIVNLQFKTDEKYSYCFTDEIESDDIL
ncbi:MAG: ATP-binding protein [Spirochaetes bacterium]|jgi:hypothetical protein|nr:ATP-binding protein [Spirochaetota bacterium]